MRNLSSIILLMALPISLIAQSPHGDDLAFDCADCHNAKGWKLEKGTYSFDHNSTKYALTGQHAKLECKMCHASLVFSQASPECMTCHTDIHEQTLGMDCGRCHTPNSWLVENITSLHQLSRFPLLGAHNTAACQDCHPSASLLKFEPLGIECYDCHEEDYTSATSPNHVEGAYSTNCTDCHNMNAFSWTGASINHNFFPLTEGHAINDCNACHKSPDYSDISSECFDCHQTDYMATTNPNHIDIAISTDCKLCHTANPGWKPAEYGEHDAQFFPIYSGEHNGEWNSCTDCHANTSNYAEFTCISCHDHNQADTDDEHNEVGGYIYTSIACFECHPTGSAEGGFNHNLSNFPLTGAHITTECIDCHANGYSGTSTICVDCHDNDYNESTNPNHFTTAISTDCALCHTTLPDWLPAAFPNHNDYYNLVGAHATIFNDCNACHAGDYNNTPNSCFGCHEDDYNQSTNPPHASSQFSTDCQSCHTEFAWTPSTFDHDGQYFPIYSGKHNGEWGACIDCHINPGNINEFSCIDCHDHNQADTDEEHTGVGGYFYSSQACFECHPTGQASGSFDHNLSIFPLTGAHITTPCLDCHASGFSGTTTICSECHDQDYNQSTNPSHTALGIPNSCETCHTTNPGWQPATFPIHNSYYVLEGAHVAIAGDCNTCHSGNYTNTPNTCFACHEEEYNQTTDPSHISAQFPTECEACHTQNAWTPATFNHDGQYFPIYSGNHEGEWESCADCHTNPNNYAIFDCLVCHEQSETDEEHQGIGGYQYNSNACYECHPDGTATGSFNHNNTSFPLTGGHMTVECIACHASGYTGTTTICSECHEDDYTQSTNPNHVATGIPIQCEDCHTTNPGWEPATFPIHGNYYPLTGAHEIISNDCEACHGGNYTNTPDYCFGCHESAYNQSSNPGHVELGLSTTCEFCHTTNPDWEPATFPVHDDYYPLTGAHAIISNDCDVCHGGDYTNTPDYCFGCHESNYNQTTNPDHVAIGIPNTCETCHTTNPGWSPATFPIHNNYWVFQGAHVNIANECDLCHFGNYTTTPNTCFGCHEDDYNQTTDPDHQAAQFPTDCEACHTQFTWVPSTFDHDNQYFPIYSGSHEGEWDACSDCHPNPNNYTIFDCLSCHEQAETDAEHDEVTGYQYNSQACLDCHPDGDGGNKFIRRD